MLLLLDSPLLILQVLCDRGVVTTLLLEVLAPASCRHAWHELVAEGSEGADLVCKK